MKNQSLLTVLGLLLVGPTTLLAEPYLKITQPYESDAVGNVKNGFVFGAVKPASSTLLINGTPVVPYSNGGFLTMIPFQEGSFKIEAVAIDSISSTTVTRTIQVRPTAKPYPADYSKIDPLSPKVRLVVRIRDTIPVSFQGAPGGKATFRFSTRGTEYPMEEMRDGIGGIYKGLYEIQPGDEFDNADIIFLLQRADRKKIHQKAGARIIVQRRTVPRIIEAKERCILVTGPGPDYGYNLFVLPGTRFDVTGESGDYLRVALAQRNQGWIAKSSITELPAGTPLPASVSRNMRIETSESSTFVELPLQYRHPYRIEQSIKPHKIHLTIYGVIPDTDRIRYKSGTSVIKEMNWSQNDTDTYTLNIETTQDLAWGYDVNYDGTKLVLEIRHRPRVPNAHKGSLKGLTVALDAGHSMQSYGTIGPWGNTEASVTLKTAKAVKKELENRGAAVVMIQDGTKDPSLQERVDWAWAAKANIYISLHCDAVDQGTDPRDVEGYSVHYYHPQSRILAEEIHTAYGKKTKITDQGLWRSNLAVCRGTGMPSILLELGFLILPEFEERFLTPEFQKLVGESLVVSLVQLFSKNPS